MAGSSAQPVAMEDLLSAKLNLEIAVRRLDSAISVMAEHGIKTILMRSRTSLTRGVSGVYAMATEAHNRAEDVRRQYCRASCGVHAGAAGNYGAETETTAGEMRRPHKSRTGCMVHPLWSAEVALAEFFRLWSDRRQAQFRRPGVPP